MSLKEALERAGRCLAAAASRRFTGRITFTLHLRQGGIAKVTAQEEYDMGAGGPEAAAAEAEGKTRGGAKGR